MYVKPRSAFSANFHAKVALVVVKMFDFLPKQIGYMSGDKWAGFILATVHENSFLFGMGMKIDEHEDTPMLKDCSLSKENLRAVDFVVVVPYTVEIVP